jgi:tetratricopeptide (TPR) repeat protein
MSVGNIGVYCQQTSADFSFLLKLRTNELNTWIKSKRKEDLIIVVNYLLKDYENQKETAISDENVRIALTIAKSSKDFLTLGKIHYIRGLGFIEKDSNKANEALDAFALAQENLINNDSQDSKILLGKTLLEIANIQINTVNGDKDREVLSNILTTYSLLKAINSQHLMGLTYKTLGLYFFYQSKYTYALSCFEKAEKYLQEIKDYNSLLEINTFSIHLFRNIFVRTKLAERKQKIEEILKFSTSKRKKCLHYLQLARAQMQMVMRQKQ